MATNIDSELVEELRDDLAMALLHIQGLLLIVDRKHDRIVHDARAFVAQQL